MKVSELARKTGLSHQRVTHYVNEERKFPMELLDTFAVALDVSPADIVNTRAVSAKSAQDANPSERFLAPYFGLVPAGAWSQPTGDKGMIEISSRFKDEADITVCKISGDSLSPRFHDGQSIVIRKSVQPVPGRVWLARNQDNEVTLKVLAGSPGAWVLKPINPESEPIAPVAEWSLIGFAIGVDEYNPDGLRP